jgi:hypothetical protein
MIETAKTHTCRRRKPTSETKKTTPKTSQKNNSKNKSRCSRKQAWRVSAAPSKISQTCEKLHKPAVFPAKSLAGTGKNRSEDVVYQESQNIKQ